MGRTYFSVEDVFYDIAKLLWSSREKRVYSLDNGRTLSSSNKRYKYLRVSL